MSENILNTEQIILEAAKQEFLEKGFARAKTTEIAKRAGVNHAMIHYYFRTKQNLFNLVLQQNIEILINIVLTSFDNNLPFYEKIKVGIERHFNFLLENPKLPFFFVSEVINNEENRRELLKQINVKPTILFTAIQKDLELEIEKGTIRKIDVLEFIYSLLALNIFIFIGSPILKDVLNITSEDKYKEFLEMARSNNINFVLNSLRP